MRSSILISGKRDSDLVALYKKIGKTEFSNMIKDALRTLVREGYKGKTKPPEGFVLQGLPNDDTIKFNLVLTSAQDDDVRELLSHIFPGKLGIFVKQALRFYLGPVSILSGFMNNEFSDLLQKNPVPVQVFAIGDMGNRTAISTKKKEKKQSKVRKQKTEIKTETSQIIKEEKPTIVSLSNPSTLDNSLNSNLSTVSESNIAINCSTTEYPLLNEVNISSITTNSETSNNDVNEEDEMLALLEGLL